MKRFISFLFVLLCVQSPMVQAGGTLSLLGKPQASSANLSNYWEAIRAAAQQAGSNITEESAESVQNKLKRQGREAIEKQRRLRKNFFKDMKAGTRIPTIKEATCAEEGICANMTVFTPSVRAGFSAQQPPICFLADKCTPQGGAGRRCLVLSVIASD